MGLNQCTFLGRLTRDPELRYAGEKQMAIARFTLAVDRRKSRDGESEADFFQCVAFDKRAEFAEQYLHSGIRVLVSGNMKNNNYTNKSGDKVYGMELQTNHIEFADGKRDGGEGDESPKTASGQKPPSEKPASKASGGSAQRSQNAATAGTGQKAPAAGNGSRSSGRRPSARSANHGDAFMNIPDGIEDEGLPFN